MTTTTFATSTFFLGFCAIAASLGCNETFVVESSGTGGSGTTSTAVSEDKLLLWLRADEGVLANDGQVTLWKDQTKAIRNNATQAIVGQRPTLDSTAETNPTIAFDGVDDSLELDDGFLDLNGGITIFAAAKPTMSAECWSILYLGNGGETDDISLGMWQDKFLFEVDQTYLQADKDVPYGEKVLLTAVLDGTSALLRHNGNGVAAGSFETVRPVLRVLNSVGAPSYDGCGYFPGSVAEIIVYGRPLSMKEIVAIETELRDRWQ